MIDASLVQKLSDEFSTLIQERHNEGAQHYGSLAFLEVDTIRMLIEELADTANYVRFLYIKYRLIEELLRERGIDLSASFSEQMGKDNSVPSDPAPFVPSTEVSGFLPRTDS